MSEFDSKYSAKVLRIDLSSRKIWSDELEAATLRTLIGGYALGARYLYDEVPASVKWSEPENRLMFLGGVLSGTLIPGAGGLSVCTKGPMTGGAAASQAQGDFAAYLRRCGFLGVILQGACDDWSYLVIDEEGRVEFKDASHLLGQHTWDTPDLLAEEMGKKPREISVLSIGPAGENLVRWAAIVGNKGHVAPHNGVGAVMGSKKLKAVVVLRGKDKVPVKDVAKLRDVSERFMVPVKADKNGIRYYGTLNGVKGNYPTGNLPVKNYTTSLWDITDEQFEKFSGPYMNDNFESRRTRPCWACGNNHCTFMTITEGDYAGLDVEEPEYEQLSAFSANLGINDVGAATMLGNLVDRLGMDANEAGWICGLMMEAYDQGIFSSEELDGLDLSWGNVEGVKELLNRIARRQGIGDVLAEGVRIAVQELGRGTEEMGVYTLKGGTPRGHDHRARWGEMLDTVLSETAAHETSMLGNIDFEQFGLPPKLHPYDPEMIAEFEVKLRGGMQLEDSAVTCRFNTGVDVTLLSEAISAVTGWEFTREEGMEVGRRSVNVMRAFNIGNGLTAELEKPSQRYGSIPTDGPAQGQSIAPHFERMVQIYYSGMGWDEKGRPLPETLHALGLDQIAADLWKNAA